MLSSETSSLQYPIDNSMADQRPNNTYENVTIRPQRTGYCETSPVAVYNSRQEQIHLLNPYAEPYPDFYPGHDTVTGQRRSLDETNTRHNILQHQTISTPAPETTSFTRQHRRGRSDELSRYFEGNREARDPVRFGSPPPTRVNYSPVHISRSTTSLDNNRHVSRYGQIDPSLFHSVSVDSAMFSSAEIQQVMYKQNTAFIKLQTSINLSQDKVKKLKKEVKKLEKELIKSLAVQKNPTEKEYRQLKDEITILHREITEMYEECDKLGISTDASAPQIPPQPPTPYLHTPSPTKTPSGGRYVEPGFQYPGYPPQPEERTLPSYSSLQVETTPPPYNSFNTYKEQSEIPSSFRPYSSTPIRHTPPRQAPARPPPPKKQDQDCAMGGAVGTEMDQDYWICPSCTFLNLLLVECEMCNKPRPRDSHAIRHQ